MSRPCVAPTSTSISTSVRTLAPNSKDQRMTRRRERTSCTSPRIMRRSQMASCGCLDGAVMKLSLRPWYVTGAGAAGATRVSMMSEARRAALTAAASFLLLVRLSVSLQRVTSVRTLRWFGGSSCVAGRIPVPFTLCPLVMVVLQRWCFWFVASRRLAVAVSCVCAVVMSVARRPCCARAAPSNYPPRPLSAGLPGAGCSVWTSGGSVVSAARVVQGADVVASPLTIPHNKPTLNPLALQPLQQRTWFRPGVRTCRCSPPTPQKLAILICCCLI